MLKTPTQRLANEWKKWFQVLSKNWYFISGGGVMPGGRVGGQPALSPRQVNGYSAQFDDGEENKLKNVISLE